MPNLWLSVAGVAAAKEHGPTIVASNTAFVLTSVGALADADIALELLGGPGRLIVTNGAIGGFDALEAICYDRWVHRSIDSDFKARAHTRAALDGQQ